MLTLCHNYFNVSPNNKSVKDVNPWQDKRRYLFGIFILLIVDILWVVSSELTKYIYTDAKLERPFLITYVRSSFLFIYLVVLCFSPPTRDPCRPADYTQLLEPSAETDDENYFSEPNNSLGDSTFVPVRAGETTDSDDAAPRAVRFNKVAEVRVMSAAQAGEALLARLSWSASLRATEHAQRRAAAAATRRHLRLAMLLALPWFMSNYLFRLTLLHASASVATIYLATLSAAFLSICAVCAQLPSNRFNLVKPLAAVLSVTGLVIVGVLDSQHGNLTAVFAAVGAALCYAVHLTVFKQELKRSDGINSPLLAGLVGCACAGLTWVMGVVLSTTGLEHADLPAPNLFSWLLLDAAIGPLLFEALWLWGYSLTSPQTATWSLTLVVPLPLLVDAWRGQIEWSRVAAAVFAALGWVLAAADDACTNEIHEWMRNRFQGQGFSTIRNIPDLDEQSEALMSNDEPT